MNAKCQKENFDLASSQETTPQERIMDNHKKPKNHYARWTSEDMGRMEDFYRRGYTALEIGRELGRSPAAIYNAMAGLRFHAAATGRSISRADKVEIAALILRDIFGVGR